MLRDSLSDVDLIQSKLPLEHPLKCKAVLKSTGLAYSDKNKQLKVLMTFDWVKCQTKRMMVTKVTCLKVGISTRFSGESHWIRDVILH
jgi:hypothetical protein